METKRSRSRSGCRAFSASETTRKLKSSQESSRLMNRAGSFSLIPGVGEMADKSMNAPISEPLLYRDDDSVTVLFVCQIYQNFVSELAGNADALAERCTV